MLLYHLEDLVASSAAFKSGLNWGLLAGGLLFTFPWQHDETFCELVCQRTPLDRTFEQLGFKMARSNESPMDFSWDNNYGPIDPTSPFSKLATMKRTFVVPQIY